MVNSQKRYVCAFCARAFTRSEHKQRHERSHTNEKPFHCLHCTSAFVRRDLLQRHCRTVHNIELKSSNIVADKTVVATEEVKQTAGPNNDTIQLLSITKKLDSLLEQLVLEEDNDIRNVNDYFLMGYQALVKVETYTSFRTIAKDLIQFLSSNSSNSRQIDFKNCLAYSIIAIGYAVNKKYDSCIKFFNKSWSVLIMKLVPSYNNNYNLSDQVDILNNLFILSYICIEYDLDRFLSPSFNSDVVFNYLNDTSYIIMSNLTNYSAELIQNNLELFWNIYILLSKYLINSPPPKFYEFFLDKKINDMTLHDTMLLYTKSIRLLNGKFEKEIVTLTLSNELNSLMYYDKFFIFDSKNSLHNSIIIVNKLVNQVRLKHEIFELFKKKLIINSPASLQDLLNNYIFNLDDVYNWNLLSITLSEFNYPFNFKTFFANFLTANSSDIEYELSLFFNNKFEINNNVIIVSFPLIFNLSFIDITVSDLMSVNLKKFSKRDLNAAEGLIISWYLTMVKVLIKLFEERDYNHIFQNLVYLMIRDKFREFELNDKWFWILKFKIDSYFEKWLEHIDSRWPNFNSFKLNLNNALLNLIKLNLNFTIINPHQNTGRSNSISIGQLQSAASLPTQHFGRQSFTEQSILHSTSNGYYSSYSSISPTTSYKVPVQHVEHARKELLLPPINSKPIMNPTKTSPKVAMSGRFYSE